MAQISQSEARDLLSKLLSERTPLIASLHSPSGADAKIPGFIDSMTRDNGLIVSVSGPPIKPEGGSIRVRPFDKGCDFWYGEKRELPEQFRNLGDVYGESALGINFPSGEIFVLFFTL